MVDERQGSAANFDIIDRSAGLNICSSNAQRLLDFLHASNHFLFKGVPYEKPRMPGTEKPRLATLIKSALVKSSSLTK
jgi:hypothetical protein